VLLYCWIWIGINCRQLRQVQVCGLASLSVCLIAFQLLPGALLCPAHCAACATAS
jgi:hypothetical protein